MTEKNSAAHPGTHAVGTARFTPFSRGTTEAPGAPAFQVRFPAFLPSCAPLTDFTIEFDPEEGCSAVIDDEQYAFLLAQGKVLAVANTLAQDDEECRAEAGEKISPGETRRRLGSLIAQLSAAIEKGRAALARKRTDGAPECWEPPSPQTALLSVCAPWAGDRPPEGKAFPAIDPAAWGGGARSASAGKALTASFWPLGFRLNVLYGLLYIAGCWLNAFTEENERFDALTVRALEYCAARAMQALASHRTRFADRQAAARKVKVQGRGRPTAERPFTDAEALAVYEAIPKRKGFSDTDRYKETAEEMHRQHPRWAGSWQTIRNACTRARRARKVEGE